MSWVHQLISNSSTSFGEWQAYVEPVSQTLAFLQKSLYESIKGPDLETLEQNAEKEAGFGLLKQAFVQAPALGIPNLTKPFTLYVAE